MSIADLPEWVWELVDELHVYDQEHPVLYRYNYDDEYERTRCPCEKVKAIVPENVWDAAGVYRVRRNAQRASSGVAVGEESVERSRREARS